MSPSRVGLAIRGTPQACGVGALGGVTIHVAKTCTGLPLSITVSMGVQELAQVRHCGCELVEGEGERLFLGGAVASALPTGIPHQGAVPAHTLPAASSSLKNPSEQGAIL